MRVFVDTGAWLAVVVASDKYHDVAVAHHEELMSGRARLFTSDYVLDEAVLADKDDSVIFDFSNADYWIRSDGGADLLCIWADMTDWDDIGDTVQVQLQDSAGNISWGINDGSGSYGESEIIFRGSIYSNVLVNYGGLGDPPAEQTAETSE